MLVIIMKKITSLCKASLIKNNGTIAVATAIMFPSLLGLYSIAIDGSRFNSDRARLNDAINHSVYALAIVNNGNDTTEDKTANVQLANKYISYYFPTETINADDVTVNATKVYDEDNLPIAIDYHVTANKISHPIFEFSSAENKKMGFNKNVTIGGNELSGSARRTTVVPKSAATDYVFVVDFSTSMQWSSSQPGYTREKLLKYVVRRLGEQVFELNNGSTIGIVPFSVGVPIRLDKTNYASASSKEIGCTYAGKMKGGYDSLDWSFWYNKPSGANTGLNISLNNFITRNENDLRHYYVNIIAKANGYTDSRAANNWLIDKGYCYVDQKGILICDADPKSSIHNEKNRGELEKNLQNYLDVSYHEYHQSGIMNEKTMDIEGTLTGDYLFDENNTKWLINFQNRFDYIPFRWSCASAYKEAYAHQDSMYQKIKEVEKPSYYLLPLTDDEKIFDEFDSMFPEGWTESLSGLLRAVPTLAQGKNPRKYMFVISDGEDNHDGFRRSLMTKHNLCGVIKDGLKKYPTDRKATESDIFYISILNNGTVKQWADECVGSANSFVATNLDELLDTLSRLMFKNTIEYINPAEIDDGNTPEDTSEENYSDKD